MAHVLRHFIVLLSLLSQHALQAQPPVEKRILFVDDDDPEHHKFGRDLAGWGIGTVDHAHSSQEALKLVNSHTYTLIITDYRMPNAGDGARLAAAIRDLGIKVQIFLRSATPEASFSANEMALFDGFIPKSEPRRATKEKLEKSLQSSACSENI